jgi:phosphopantetheinyl transferase
MISVYTKIFETPQRFKPKQSLPIVLDFLSAFLKRTVVSSEISYSSKGKPSLIDNSLSFSVSHSGQFLAVACSQEVRVGLDIQIQMKVNDSVIQSTLTRNEMSQSQWLQHEVHFLDVWCIKEAALKWIGNGLSMPLTDLEISFKPQIVEAGEYGVLRYTKLDLFSEVTSYLVFNQAVKS